MVAALTSFFKVQKTGANVEEKRLDKVMGVAVIARAGASFLDTALCVSPGTVLKPPALLFDTATLHS